MKKIFNCFAAEPTFYFNTDVIKIPNFLKDHYGVDNILENATDAVSSELKSRSVFDKHPWFINAYEDGDALEIPTTIYSEKKRFISDYRALSSYLKTKYDFLPSSCVDIEIEGGCHLNVSIPDEVKNSDLAKTFFYNLQKYLISHPSIIWSFLAPTDNQSSQVSYNSDPRKNSKGEFFTIRAEEGKSLRRSAMMFGPTDPIVDYVNKTQGVAYLKYTRATRIELRFFMQPETVEQMELEIDFGLHLLNWIWQRTLRGDIFKRKNKKTDVQEYANNKAKTLKEIKDVCSEMEFSYQRLVDCGRIENLKTKFQYHQNYFA